MDSSVNELEDWEVIRRYAVKLERVEKDPLTDVKTKENPNKFKFCPKCSRKFTRNANFVKEFTNHLMKHKVIDFVCDCPETANNESETGLKGKEFKEKLKHMKVHHEGWHECHVCEQYFETEGQINDHIIGHQSKLGNSKLTKSPRKRRRRVKPIGPVLCSECGKCFEKSVVHFKQKFRSHQLIHKIDKIKCECPDAHAKELDLIVPFNKNKRLSHIKIKHLGWHGCLQCTECFETIGKLKTHIIAHNLNLKCDECGYLAKNTTIMKAKP